MAVQGPAYPVSPTLFAVESAFAEHLSTMRAVLAADFDRIVLVAPHMTDDAYRGLAGQMTEIAADSGVVFVPAMPAGQSVARFWRGMPGLLRRLRGVMATAGAVQADLATDVRRPMTLFTGLMARRAGRPTMLVVDIDYRQHARRRRLLGEWGLAKYLANRLVIQPFKSAQIRLAVRTYACVLLKGAAMTRDFGRGRPHVRNFYDTVHDAGHVLSADATVRRVAAMRARDRPLELVHFGRAVAYKGIDRMVTAIGLLRDRGRPARLTVIGDGDQVAALRRQVADAGLEDWVRFEPPVRYGEALFERLGEMDAMLAAPLVEDTPRAAFDAMARGLPIIAFDIDYFRGLADHSGAVALAAWPDPAALADQIDRLDRDRDALSAMAMRGVDFARENCQEQWLARRAAWIRAFLTPPPTDRRSGARA